MPGLNRRGPNQEGPMTGRKLGKCNPENRGRSEEEILQNRMNTESSSFSAGRGRRLGRGNGMGKGFGRCVQ